MDDLMINKEKGEAKLKDIKAVSFFFLIVFCILQ